MVPWSVRRTAAASAAPRGGYGRVSAMAVLVGTSGRQYRHWRDAFLPGWHPAAVVAPVLSRTIRHGREQRHVLPSTPTRPVRRLAEPDSRRIRHGDKGQLQADLLWFRCHEALSCPAPRGARRRGRNPDHKARLRQRRPPGPARRPPGRPWSAESWSHRRRPSWRSRSQGHRRAGSPRSTARIRGYAQCSPVSLSVLTRTAETWADTVGECAYRSCAGHIGSPGLASVT